MTTAGEAFAAHCLAWNDGDRQTWLSLFHPDVTMEDPVGGPLKVGVEALATTWDRSHAPGRSWQLEPRRIIDRGSEAAIDLANIGTLGDETVEITSIEIWRVDGTGLVRSVRSFFTPDETVHDPWYVPTPGTGAQGPDR